MRSEGKKLTRVWGAGGPEGENCLRLMQKERLKGVTRKEREAHLQFGRFKRGGRRD